MQRKWLSVQAMMQAKGFSDYDAHKKLHDDFMVKVGEMATPVGTDSVQFAKNWLVQICFFERLL